MTRARILPLFVPHLGCPHMCVFCDQRRISGQALPVTGKDVRGALSAARDRGDRGLELAFYGGSFTAVPWRTQCALLAAAQPYLADGTVASVRLSTRPDAVSAESLRALRAYGVATVELGAQSMSERVLALSRRGHTASDTECASALVKAAGLRLILQMMTGLPGADRATDIETARRLIALSPDGVRVYPTVIVRGTPLEEMWRAGQYTEHTTADAVAVCADILPLFEQARIPVIRLGLNPTEELSAGGAVAGAYHPAFGELVRSEVLRRRAVSLLLGTAPGGHVVLRVAPGRVSAMVGQHRANVRALREQFGLSGLAVQADPALAGDAVEADVLH